MALTERLALIVDASTGGAVRGLKQVADAAKDMENATGKSEAQLKLLQARSDSAAKSLKTGLSVAAGAVGAGLLAGFAAAANAAMKFDKEMSAVGAVANATAGDMDKLRVAALQAGKDTVFSASEAAKAEAELAKAGVSVSDILGGGLTGALDLAAAGQLELAEAATIAAQAMNIFNLAGADVSHVADVLAAGANKSAADVKSLGDGLKQGGLIAKQTGLSLETTVGALSLFADNALVGSDAGTSLKTMLMRLVPQSDKAREAMKDIGFSAYDANGQFVGLEGVAEQLKKGLSGLSDEQRSLALTTIFGSDATRAAGVLYEAGAKGIREYTKAVNDQGAAQRMAAAQMDNLAGDLEALKGSIETALIGSGSGGTAGLRFLTQSANEAVNAFLGLPGPVQGAVGAVAGVSGVALTAAAGFGLLAPKIRETRASLEAMGGVGQKASGALGFLGKVGGYGVLAAAGVGLASAAFEALGDAIHGAAPDIADVTDGLASFNTDGEAAGVAAELFGSQLEGLDKVMKKAADNRNKLPIFGDWADQIDGIKAAKDKVDSLDKSLAALARSGETGRNLAADLFEKVISEGKQAGRTVEQTEATFDNYGQVLAEVSTEEKLVTEGMVDITKAAKAFDVAAAAASVKGLGLFSAMSKLSGGLAGAITAGLEEADIKARLKPFEEAAKRMADAIDIGGIWKNVAENAGGSLKVFSKDLAASLKSVETWRNDLNNVAVRGGYEFARQLEELGPQAAGLVAKIGAASAPEFEKIRAQFKQAAEYASVDFAIALSLGMQALPLIAASGGKLTAEAIATSIGAGTPEVIALVRAMAVRIGITLAENPAEVVVDTTNAEADLLAFVRKPRTVPISPSFLTSPGGGTAPMFGAPPTADGGIFGSPQLRLISEAGPEAVIPLSASKSGRRAQLMSQAGLTGNTGTSTTHVTIVMPPGSDGDDVVNAIQRYERRNGAGWRSAS